MVDIYFSQVIPSTYCYYTIYTYLARQVTRAPAENVSSVSRRLFLMTFLLLNGHDFCVPPSMNFLSLCTIQLMIILILSLQKPLLYLSLCNLPIAICALNCELNVWERSQISKPYMPLWLDVSCFLIHISKFLYIEVRIQSSRYLIFSNKTANAFGILKYT